MLEILAKGDATDGDATDKGAEENLASAKRDKDLAEQECIHGFPLLYEQATISLWSSLEVLVRALVAQLLLNHDESWQCAEIRKLKVSPGEFMQLESYERCLWITDLLDQESKGEFRQGVNRFESLLAPFGLSGALEDHIKRSLFELSHVRHVLVHRGGIVDRRMLDSCKVLGYSIGEQVRVDHDLWRRFDSAVGAYVLEIIQRMRVRSGLKRWVCKTHSSPEISADAAVASVGEGE